MKGYSFLSLARQALSGNKGWPVVWRSPEPKKNYDVVIIGAGGHGLATAYYLAKNHGIKNIAVLEKGWLGGGNTGRNTQVTRSNYYWPQSAAFSGLCYHPRRTSGSGLHGPGVGRARNRLTASIFTSGNTAQVVCG